MANLIPTAIGRVVPIYKGEWSPESSYEKLDNVLYNDSTYVALKDVSGEQHNPAADSSSWQLVSKKGNVGIVKATASIIDAG
jgi:hypothetical protein